MNLIPQKSFTNHSLTTGVCTSRTSWLQFGTASDTIRASKSIKDPEFIISQGGVFRLGFLSFANSTNRYVGILYNQIPVQTVVWVANRNRPLKDSSGILTISDDGNLVVSNGKAELLWSTNVTNLVPNATTAQLLDSGNLVLNNGDNGGSSSLWESFQHPSNAFLQTMKMGVDVKTGRKVRTRSWKGPDDPSDGNFSEGLEPFNIPESVLRNNNQIYFRTGPWNGHIYIGLIEMNNVYLDGFYVVADDEGKSYYETYEYSNKSMLIYYELDYDGRFVQRKWDAGKGDWINNYLILKTDCDFYGKCGAFGICDPKKQPICRCSKGFKPRNAEEWSRGNWSSGCFRTTPLQCQRDNNNGSGGAGQSDDGFLKLKTMKAPAFPDRSSIINGECKDQCMKNCSCVAYAYDAGIGCMFWSGDLIDVQKFPTRGVDLYIRLPSSELDQVKSSKIIVITTVIAGILIITISTLFLWCRIAKYKGENPIGVKLQQLPLFNFEELATATNNFHPEKKLGQGDFGMARIFGGDENQANTKRVVGTYGYMSPEYAMQGQFSEKSDVFSYGVLLLEIVSGRRNTSFYNNKDDLSLLGYAWKLWREGNIWGLVDKVILESKSYSNNEKEIWRCIHVGLLCVQEYTKDRPTISTVISMLNSEISDLNTPKQLAFTQAPQMSHDVEDRGSLNDVTLTNLDGR
ncbi:hypothetical protein GOBAR_DD21197 [Gossypium barbadense]|nr:hypothetical protein GOBAR_DD21197 [Gossypium barbadense]